MSNLKNLKRRFKATGEFGDFLRYRLAYARAGYCDVLKLKKGMFIVSYTWGGTSYIKSSGKIKTKVMSSPFRREDNESFYAGTYKTKASSEDTDSVLYSRILCPPVMAEYMESIRREFYFASKRYDQLTPRYQEDLYTKLVTTLQGFGYCQPEVLEDLICTGTCGRSLGLATPARQRESICIRCFREAMTTGGRNEGMNEEWVKEMEDRQGGYAYWL